METPIPSDIGEYLSYDPSTGDLTWIKRPSRKVRAGSVAGCLCKTEGYVKVGFKGKLYQGHRICWFLHYGEQPPAFPESIDHENRVRHDNRIDNLRRSTPKKQNQNMGTACTNTSGHTGVYWEKRGSQWVARITVDRKTIFLGYYDDKEDAIQARKAGEEKYWNK
jgi:hypothetical protein